jgi:hypothetical protein
MNGWRSAVSRLLSQVCLKNVMIKTYQWRRLEKRDWVLDFRRNFGEKEMTEWRSMTEKLERITLAEENDKVIWKLEKSGNFTTKSMHRYITFGGIIDTRMMEIWMAKIPLKVQIFCGWHGMTEFKQHNNSEEETGMGPKFASSVERMRQWIICCFNVP